MHFAQLRAASRGDANPTLESFMIPSQGVDLHCGQGRNVQKKSQALALRPIADGLFPSRLL